jgi:hypothetical protein
LLFDELSADVGSQDNDCVPEIDFSAERIGDFSFLKDLQEEMKHVWVRFFDFVE